MEHSKEKPYGRFNRVKMKNPNWCTKNKSVIIDEFFYLNMIKAKNFEKKMILLASSMTM